MACHTGRLWRRHLMPCQNITPATVLPNFDGLPCQATDHFMSHLPSLTDRWLSQTWEWMRHITLRNTLADPFTLYLFTYTVPGSCDVLLWHGISLFTFKGCHCSMITPWQFPSIENCEAWQIWWKNAVMMTCFLVLDKMTLCHRWQVMCDC